GAPYPSQTRPGGESVASRVDQVAEMLPALDMGGSRYGMVPGTHEPAHHPIGAIGHEVLEIVGGILEVDVAVHLPLAVEDMNLPGGDAVLGQPGEGVVDRPRRFGGEDHDLVPVLGQSPQRVDGTRVCL